MYLKLLHHQAFHPIARIRQKQARWHLHDSTRTPQPPDTSIQHNTPNWQANRTHHLLEHLSSLTSPRVRAAVFSTIWNRWCTRRRWQQRHKEENKCVLGCSPTAERRPWTSLKRYLQDILPQVVQVWMLYAVGAVSALAFASISYIYTLCGNLKNVCFGSF